jgi:hypothetical protein
MLKMAGGFETGKGVGKANQGIIKPIEAVARKGNSCIGSGENVVKD